MFSIILQPFISSQSYFNQMLDTRNLLSKKGYEFYYYVEEPVNPEYSNITFDNIISFPPEVHGHLKLLKGKTSY